METNDLVELLETTKTPAGFILVFLVILATFSGLVSKAAADYGGVFGAFARALQRRKEEAIAADERSNARRLDRLEDTIESLEREIAKLRERDSSHYKYQLYVAEYWRDLKFWAVKEAVELPPPALLTYPEWKALQEDAT